MPWDGMPSREDSADEGGGTCKGAKGGCTFKIVINTYKGYQKRTKQYYLSINYILVSIGNT